MAKYIMKCQKALPHIERAFPEGLTAEQIDVIGKMIRACIVRPQSGTILNTAMKTLFPKAKFSERRVQGIDDYTGKEYDYMKQFCSEGYTIKVENYCDVCDCDPCQCDQYPSNEEEALKEIPNPPKEVKLNLFKKA